MQRKDWLDQLTSKTCTVIGLGISNRPLISFLLGHGAAVTARDRSERQKLGAYADELEALGVRLFLGEDYLENITEEVVFRSPGIRPDLPQIDRAVKRGAILTSEMELFLELTPARTVGITGSDGKTTTTTLTHLILEEAARRRGGRVFVGGNIGTPLLPLVEEMGERDVAVVELSSFQLMTAPRSVERAAITNLSPNHLNWHVDMEEYIQSKTNIYRHAPNQRAVFNADNPTSHALIASYGGVKTLFSSSRATRAAFGELLGVADSAVYARDGVVYLSSGAEERAVMRVSDLLLPGVHNLENMMTAIAITDGMADAEDVCRVASSFVGVEHRLERVRVLDGVTYYNSSIDSTPTRTAAALSALPKKPIVICGGCDKHIPFDTLAESICSKARAVVLTGETAPAIAKALEEAQCPLPIYRRDRFDDAVVCAHDVAETGDIVLLSPACASFDAFANFMERGRRFKDLVNRFTTKENPNE